MISPQTCRVNTQDAKHALILAGVGWGRLPHWLVSRDLAEGRLDEPMGPAARKFAEALVQLNASSASAPSL